MCLCALVCPGDLQQILSQDIHPSYSAELYSAFINILLGVFYTVCRDLRELRHLVRTPQTPAGVMKGQAPNDTRDVLIPIPVSEIPPIDLANPNPRNRDIHLVLRKAF